MSAFAGDLVLRAKLRDGEVAAVEIASPRKNPAPIFVGLSPAEAATLAGRLFSLCPAAQSLAAQAAGEAALGLETGPELRRVRALKLLSERLGEMLRASVLDWPCDDAPASGDVMRLRDALNNLRTLPRKNAAPESIVALLAATEGLEPFFARQLAEARDDARWDLSQCEPDYLSAADDAAVCAAMARDTDFSRAPSLPGRRAETGAAARQKAPGGGVAARLAARFSDMAATVKSIKVLLEGGEAPDELLAAHSDGAGRGFAAVDSARGRLYHALQIDRAGRIADYGIVAPTEWNFHPDGPFVHFLRGARVGEGAVARRRVERLAFVFDPCIRARAEILDEAHA